jgi:hypothetical protein
MLNSIIKKKNEVKLYEEVTFGTKKKLSFKTGYLIKEV